MSTSLIACINKNRGLGLNNQLLYKIPEDLKFFKEKTAGHTVIMGKKTFESIGRPLPHRTNIIITRDKNFKADGCTVCHSINEALAYASLPSTEGAGGGQTGDSRAVFIIGGAQIYAQTINKADKLYLTIVDDDKPADAYFPSYHDFKKTTILSEGEYKSLKYQIVMLEKS
ncbi:MAG: dihydrofolate reductase [Candidatus Doudnabacteria bacterium]|nr:dihydrofolate reductase [Candidatus Doudnabacteria bacterium]